MHSYIDLMFDAEGPTPPEISDRLRAATGFEFIVGPHDIAFEWQTVEEFQEKLAKIHAALKGTGAYYRIETASEEPGAVTLVTWPPATARNRPAHPKG